MWAQSCPTLSDPMDCSPPASSVHGILQARILEWATISYSRGYSQPRIKPMSLASPALAGRFFATAPAGKPKAASEHPTTPALVSFPGPPWLTTIAPSFPTASSWPQLPMPTSTLLPPASWLNKPLSISRGQCYHLLEHFLSGSILKPQASLMLAFTSNHLLPPKPV